MIDRRSPNVCCGLVPHLELALHPERRGQPVVVGAGGHVLATSEEARAAGVRPGLTLRQAEAICPRATVVEPQPEAASRLADRIAAGLYNLAPVVEVRADGHAWADLEGVPRPVQALREVRRRLRQATLAEPRLGLAPGPAAWSGSRTHARSWPPFRSRRWGWSPSSSSGWSCSACARWDSWRPSASASWRASSALRGARRGCWRAARSLGPCAPGGRLR
jgi:hypothetical protein